MFYTRYVIIVIVNFFYNNLFNQNSLYLHINVITIFQAIDINEKNHIFHCTRHYNFLRNCNWETTRYDLYRLHVKYYHFSYTNVFNHNSFFSTYQLHTYFPGDCNKKYTFYITTTKFLCELGSLIYFLVNRLSSRFVIA